jgi:dUTP pyrophosphatase
MKVKFKRFHEDAKIPTKAYGGDFCYDVYAVTEEEIAPNVWKYGLGFGLQIERGNEELFKKLFVNIENAPLNLSIDLRPRSSVWKTGMVLSSCIGTIDEGYTNEISAVYYHVFPNMPRYKVGDRVGQIKIGCALPIAFEEVTELEERERGLNGYGSSGK